jgi:hypothetical protein
MSFTNFVTQNNKETLTKFNNNLVQPQHFPEIEEEDIPEELIDETLITLPIVQASNNQVLDSFITNIAESDHFDKNMSFELPLSALSHQIDEPTRVIPSKLKLTSHNNILITNAPAILEESIDERIVSE